MAACKEELKLAVRRGKVGPFRSFGLAPPLSRDLPFALVAAFSAEQRKRRRMRMTPLHRCHWQIWGMTRLQAFFQEDAFSAVSVITKNFAAGKPATRIEPMGIHQQGSTFKLQHLPPIFFSGELSVLNQQIGNAVPAGLWHDVHVFELGIAFLQNQNAATNSNFIHSGYKDTDVTCKR